MIVTEILKGGFAIIISDKERDQYDKKMQGIRNLLIREVKERYRRSHRFTAAFGALSHLKELSSDEIRDTVLMQDRYCLTFKFKMKTTPLLLKLDKLIEYIECKVLSIKSKLFTL